MSAAAIFTTLSMTDFPAMKAEARQPSLAARFGAWLAGQSRRRFATAERALLESRWPLARGFGAVVWLDCARGTPAACVTRLRGLADGSVDTIASVGALADADDVEALLADVKRVLRPGGRFLFVESAAAPAGTRLRRLQRTRVIDRAWRLLGGSVNAPRDLWNDVKAARFARLEFEHVNLSGLAGVPVPHLVGEAVLSAAGAVALATLAGRSRRPGTARLAWRAPGLAFFGP